MASAGARLRAAMLRKCVPLPGAFNGLTARCAAQRGFEGLYISGAALTADAGLPDIGVLTLDHFSNKIREVSRASALPLLCDADTGFGEGEMVTRTVWEYAHAGAGGLHVEDQVFPKRCGHLDGKSLVPLEEFAQVVRMARAAVADSRDAEFVVCARTDAKGVEGFDRAVERARAYVEAGADMIFPEGLTSAEEFRRFAEEMKKVHAPAREGAMPQSGPFMLANMTEFGKTEYIRLQEFHELGYHCVIYPVTTLRCAMKGAVLALDTLNAEGSMEPILGSMMTRKELYQALHYTPGKFWSFPSNKHN